MKIETEKEDLLEDIFKQWPIFKKKRLTTLTLYRSHPSFKKRNTKFPTVNQL